MTKGWYKSKTIILAALTSVQSLLAYFTVQHFPDMALDMVSYMAMINIVIAFAIKVVRFMPSNGMPLTETQAIKQAMDGK